MLYSCRTVSDTLPPKRTKLACPLTHPDVDFAGHFEIKFYIGHGCRITKRYMLISVCFTIWKAQFLLAAFTQITSRRGCTAHIYSNNGAAFVGAANLMGKDRGRFFTELKYRIVSETTFQLVEWHLIPLYATHTYEYSNTAFLKSLLILILNFSYFVTNLRRIRLQNELREVTHITLWVQHVFKTFSMPNKADAVGNMKK